MSLCSWGQWLVMWAFCMTWRCWFCLVPHEEYLSLVCEQKATKQVEFIQYSDRLVALYPWWSGWSFFEGTLPCIVIRRRRRGWTRHCAHMSFEPVPAQCKALINEQFCCSGTGPFSQGLPLCVFFQLHILLCSFLQLHSSCIPVANSSCKFYFHWGKHSQARQSLKPDI